MIKTEKEFKNRVDYMVKLAKIEKRDEYSKWMREIPYIELKPEWKIQPIPPFGGAIVRFRVQDIRTEKMVSVYLDCYERLGFFSGGPYWEVYPYQGDVGRCDIGDTDELISMIKMGLLEGMGESK